MGAMTPKKADRLLSVKDQQTEYRKKQYKKPLQIMRKGFSFNPRLSLLSFKGISLASG